MAERTRDQWVERRADAEANRLQNENTLLWSTIGEFRIHIENLKRDEITIEGDIKEINEKLDALRDEIREYKASVQPIEGAVQKQIGKWVLTVGGIVGGIIGMGLIHSFTAPVVENISTFVAGGRAAIKTPPQTSANDGTPRIPVYTLTGGDVRYLTPTDMPDEERGNEAISEDKGPKGPRRHGEN
jgi:hypothetical protein